jgi:hypothetical protein
LVFGETAENDAMDATETIKANPIQAVNICIELERFLNDATEERKRKRRRRSMSQC